MRSVLTIEIELLFYNDVEVAIYLQKIPLSIVLLNTCLELEKLLLVQLLGFSWAEFFSTHEKGICPHELGHVFRSWVPIDVWGMKNISPFRSDNTISRRWLTLCTYVSRLRESTRGITQGRMKNKTIPNVYTSIERKLSVEYASAGSYMTIPQGICSK